MTIVTLDAGGGNRAIRIDRLEKLFAAAGDNAGERAIGCLRETLQRRFFVVFVLLQMMIFSIISMIIDLVQELKYLQNKSLPKNYIQNMNT